MNPRGWAPRRVLYWVAPSLVCLLLYWRALFAWFRADDFVWLGLALRVHNFHDLLDALFLPGAQGTFRPLSERAFFMAGFSLFGMEALPFRIVIFGTQFANLVLVAAIGNRLSGRRTAGFAAAILWLMNGVLIEPLGWVCVYNQVMCGFFLLLAFYFLLRSLEAAALPDSRAARRFEILQWVAFLAGFGAQELNLVYPAIAAVYTLLCARPYFRRTLALFPVSILYVVAHNYLAPLQKSGDYVMHFTGGIFRTLVQYWSWSVGPVFLQTPLQLPTRVIVLAILVLTLGLLAFTLNRLRAGARAALFCLAWYVITISPVLPLRDHLTEYYVYIPLIGVSWLGGWALSFAENAALRVRLAASVLVALYVLLVVPRAVNGSAWNYGLTMRARDLLEGVAHAHKLHPKQTILLDGVDAELFGNTIQNHPFRILGLENVYLTPGTERQIGPSAAVDEVSEFVLAPAVTAKAIERGEAVVYDVRGPALRNITTTYAAMPREGDIPLRVDAGNPLDEYLLGADWYPNDGGHRWMPGHSTLRIGGPAAPGQKLHLHGYCTPEQLRAGPIQVTVTVGAFRLIPATIEPGTETFDLSFVLPTVLIGQAEIPVRVDLNRTYRPPADGRDLGLAFGTFEIR